MIDTNKPISKVMYGDEEIPIQGGYPEPTGTIDIYNNGSVSVKDYATANVEVIPNLQDKIINQNGLVEADEGFDGLNSVLVNVGGGGKKHEVEVTPTEAKSALTVDCPFRPTSFLVVRQEPFVANADVRGFYRGVYFEIFDNETLQCATHIAEDNIGSLTNNIAAQNLNLYLIRVVSYDEVENKATLNISSSGRFMTVGKTYTLILRGD